MYQIGVALLTALAFTSLGGAGALVFRHQGQARRARRRIRTDDVEKNPNPGERLRAPGLTGAVQRVGEAVSAGATSATLRQELARAGYFRHASAAVYLGMKVVLLLLVLPPLALLVIPSGMPFALKAVCIGFGALIAFMVPNVVVSSRRRRRKREIEKHLPDAIDLLEICVTAGMGLDAAWNAVSADIRGVSSTLADEMELTSLEISLGATRAVAMRHMAERTVVQEIASLVTLLVQSDRFGASIVDALRVFANSMRESRTLLAEEAAEKMAVKMLFPMVLFIFPALLIVMVGPAAMEIFDVMMTD